MFPKCSKCLCKFWVQIHPAVCRSYGLHTISMVLAAFDPHDLENLISFFFADWGLPVCEVCGEDCSCIVTCKYEK